MNIQLTKYLSINLNKGKVEPRRPLIISNIRTQNYFLFEITHVVAFCYLCSSVYNLSGF